jgi:hypothetical protein
LPLNAHGCPTIQAWQKFCAPLNAHGCPIIHSGMAKILCAAECTWLPNQSGMAKNLCAVFRL